MCDFYETFWLWRVQWHWKTVLDVCWKVSPQLTVELKRSTEQCCTEYFWHWNSCDFSCHHRCLEGSPIALRVSAAPQLCTYSTKSCLGGLLPPLFSIKAQTHVVVADVIMAQSEVWHFWRKYIWKKLEMYKVSHEEGTGSRVRTYGNACVCVYVCLRVHMCACTVSLCTHICTCFGLYMAMRMSQTTEAGGWVRLSVETSK